MIARAITLVESTADHHRVDAVALLEAISPAADNCRRVGITGVPGVGKSTLIDQLGINLIAAGHRVAVLAVDPSSTRTSGSILADKTRMARLAADARAYIRPSPSSGMLGGVALRTREAMLICEAAGFDVILVETVGVGQSETAVAGMVDCFVALALPGAGDDLQGIKKGVVELADVIAVNKSDGETRSRAQRAAADLRAALDIVVNGEAGWRAPVLTVSAIENDGLDRLWAAIERHRSEAIGSGAFAERRRQQLDRWLDELLRQRLWERAMRQPSAEALLANARIAVAAGRLVVPRAVENVVAALSRLRQDGRPA